MPVLEKIQTQVERADAIVCRLRTLIKKRSVDMAACDVEQLISDTVELLNFRLQKQGIEVVRSTEGQPQLVEADAVGLQQVLVNVMSNSIDACVMYAENHPNNYQAKLRFTRIIKPEVCRFECWITVRAWSMRTQPPPL
ncbi:tetrathionate reductase sensory transduction histidine kinase [Vibrio sp. JCM 19052]|nr:tetrathionate reductase sensory transduction histidine kinase [Vibrio sp. JCM 19052]